MGRLLFILTFLMALFLLPINSFGTGTNDGYSTVEGFWPARSSDCDAYSRRDQCQYLLCLCYVGCNLGSDRVEMRRKQVCDDQYDRCRRER